MATSAAAIHKSSELSDLELIASAIRGREDGFEALVKRYQRPIAGYIFRMLGDYEASLDVSQEVFIKVYNSLTRYSSEYKLVRISFRSNVRSLRRSRIENEVSGGRRSRLS